MRHSTAQCVTLACLLEVTAPKPGNVHRGADFDDLTLTDFLVSGAVIGPLLEQATTLGVGQAMLEAARSTRQIVGTNSNLGMILLLGPLAAVPREQTLRPGVAEVLNQLDRRDTEAIWQAINHAQPGGMGAAPQHDLAGPPPGRIVEAMQLAADRDLIAAQYANGYHHVFEFVAPWLLESHGQFKSLLTAIVHTHVRLLAEFPDTLIARKAGRETAEKAAHLARQVLATGSPDSEMYHQALGDLDFWLRSDGHRRNPGTTADLIAAGLFVLLRDELIEPPYR
jgi:triphosphoribosyl-dephospho-CoA synthase